MTLAHAVAAKSIRTVTVNNQSPERGFFIYPPVIPLFHYLSFRNSPHYRSVGARCTLPRRGVQIPASIVGISRSGGARYTQPRRGVQIPASIVGTSRSGGARYTQPRRGVQIPISIVGISRSGGARYI